MNDIADGYVERTAFPDYRKLEKRIIKSFIKEIYQMAAITINDVRFSYLDVFQAKPPVNNPGGDPKFSTDILIPKSNTRAKAVIDQAIAAAIAEGEATKWGNVRPNAAPGSVYSVPVTLYDGDGQKPKGGEYSAEYKGCWVLRAKANADRKPFVVDAQVQPIIDPTQVYSGMWGNASVSFYAYNKGGNKGIGCGLNGLQKTRDDEPLSSRVTAQDAFQPAGLATPSFGGAMPATPGYGYNPAAAAQTPWGAQVNPFTGQPV